MNATGSDIDINVNGITVCYDDFGKGVMPIIFVHGFPFNKSLWQPQMDYFKRTHRVIAYDIRGLGKSTPGKEEESMGLLAADLVKFMDALEIGKAIVCGLSMGGYILLNAVHHYPQRFEAIVLSDTQCFADSHEMKVKRYKAILNIMADGTEGFVDEFISSVFSKESLETKKDMVEKIRLGILSTSSVTVIRTLTVLAKRWQMCTSLNEISVPTLILCGSEDKLTPLFQSEFMLKHIKDSLLYSIDNAGHLPNIEQPEEFNRHLLDFISSIGRII
jgi:pimeloyl-ACP methyl ester carboxylesterase